MEGDRARRLTTLAVGATLGLALAVLAVGLVLALMAGADWSTAAVPVARLPGALAAARPAAWLSLGGLLLVAVPSVRLVGMLVGFWNEGDRRALAAGLVLLAILLAA